MRYLVLSDIHANLEALEACLSDAATRRYERVLVLGDLIGYGADPNAVVDRVRGLQPTAIVRGNHDKVALDVHEADTFNLVARAAAIWTSDQLTPDHRAWLAALPRGPVVVDDLVEICHGSPLDEDEYVFGGLEAEQALEAATRPLCLFGHTHCPTMFESSGDEMRRAAATTRGDTEIALQLRNGVKYLVNPGAVGQPRDGNPRAAYAIVDTSAKRVSLIRLEYATTVAQQKVLQAGLPEALARRLAVGR